MEREDEPVPRVVIITRDDECGFGFVAGSEKPVIVRYVKEGGPSENLLETGDEILEINGENVYKAAREKVISLVKSSGKTVTIKCCQPAPKNVCHFDLCTSQKAALKSVLSKGLFVAVKAEIARLLIENLHCFVCLFVCLLALLE